MHSGAEGPRGPGRAEAGGSRPGVERRLRVCTGKCEQHEEDSACSESGLPVMPGGSLASEPGLQPLLTAQDSACSSSGHWAGSLGRRVGPREAETARRGRGVHGEPCRGCWWPWV